MSRVSRRAGIFATTKRLMSTVVDLTEDSILLVREELTSTKIQNADENQADEVIAKISLVRELKAFATEDADEAELLASAIKAIKANRR